MVQQKDIAKACGVSPSTVCRALAGDIRISQEVRESIEVMAKEMGWKPKRKRAKAVEVNLVPKKKIVANIFVNDKFSDKMGHLILQILHHLTKGLSGQGITTSIIHYHEGEDYSYFFDRDNIDPDREIAILMWGVPFDFADRLCHLLPCVSINYRYPGLPISSVRSTEETDIEILLGKLKDKGHERMAFMTTNPLHQLGIRRFSGYLGFLGHHNMDYDENIVFNIFKRTFPEREFMKDLWPILKREKVTSIFFATGFLAIRAIEELREIGVRVPEDISVVGYDHIREEKSLDLTGMAPRYNRMADSCMDIIAEWVRTQKFPTKVVDISGQFNLGETIAERP